MRNFRNSLFCLIIFGRRDLKCGRGWMEGDRTDGAGWRETDWAGLDGGSRNGRAWMEGDGMDVTGWKETEWTGLDEGRQADPDRQIQTVRPRQTHPDRHTRTDPRATPLPIRRVLLTNHCHHMQAVAVLAEVETCSLAALGVVHNLSSHGVRGDGRSQVLAFDGRSP